MKERPSKNYSIRCICFLSDFALWCLIILTVCVVYKTHVRIGWLHCASIAKFRSVRLFRWIFSTCVTLLTSVRPNQTYKFTEAIRVVDLSCARRMSQSVTVEIGPYDAISCMSYCELKDGLVCTLINDFNLPRVVTV